MDKKNPLITNSNHKKVFQLTNFKLDLFPLFSLGTDICELTVSIQLPKRYGLETIAFSAQMVISANLTLQSVRDNLLVRGTLSGVAQGECSRCLVMFTYPHTVNVVELFVQNNHTNALVAEDQILYKYDGRILDLEQLVIDKLVGELPTFPLCGESCLGLCSVCGENLNIVRNETHCHQELKQI